MRRAVLVIVLAAVIAGTAAAWFRVRQASTQPSTGASTGSARQSAGSGQAPGLQGEATVLHLGTDAPGGIVAGTPVFFTVTLKQPTSVPRTDESWLSSLRFETAGGTAISWPVRRLGAVDVIDFSRMPAPTGDASRPSAPPGARLSRIRYGIDPDTTAQIPAGVHTIRAAADVDGTRLTSDQVQVQVVARTESPLPSEQWLQAGRFHIEAQEFDRAHAIALKLVEAADNAEAYILLGDAFAGLRRDEEAIAAYTEALASIRKVEGDEPPQRILVAIARARDRLEALRR